MRKIALLIGLVVALTLTACGGSGGVTREVISGPGVTAAPSMGGNPAPVPSPADPAPTQVEYVGYAPNINGIAYGPDVRPQIANFDALSAEERAAAVAAFQRDEGVRYSANLLAYAMARGIRPWASGQEWLGQLNALHNDAHQRVALQGQVANWEAHCVTSVEVKYVDKAYNSTWFERSSGVPMLVQGPGHADVAGWVIERAVLQVPECIGFWSELGGIEVLQERLVCDFQIVLPRPIPGIPEIPPPGPTPTTVPPTAPPTTPPTTVPPTTVPPTVPPTTKPPYTTTEPSQVTIAPPMTAPPMTTPPTAPPDTAPPGQPVNQIDQPSTTITTGNGNTGVTQPSVPGPAGNPTNGNDGIAPTGEPAPPSR